MVRRKSRWVVGGRGRWGLPGSFSTSGSREEDDKGAPAIAV